MALTLDISTDALRVLLGGRLRSGTPRRTWAFLRSPRDAGTGDVAILGRRVSLWDRRDCRAGLRIVGEDDPDDSALEVRSPEDALATLVFHLASTPIPDIWWTPEEVVERFGELARFSRIHRSAILGEGCRLGAGVVMHAGSIVGAECVLCDHVVLGSPGFGIHRSPVVEPVETCRTRLVSTGSTTGRPTRPSHLLLPHRAGVVLGDDVFLGPHVNVAAGLIDPTTIGSGSRLDAHIQIGHNVRIGARCILAGQAGMAGSSELGDDCLVGGQAAISDHVRLGHRCVIAAKAGVTKSFGDDFFLQGFPARPGHHP